MHCAAQPEIVQAVDNFVPTVVKSPLVSISEQLAPADDLTDAKTFARIARGIFGNGVTLHRGRYDSLWGGK